jgi:hypothetical protein
MRGRVERCEKMARKKRETEREVGAREDGEGFDENVGDGLVTGQMRVELVSAMPLSVNEQAVVTCTAVEVDGFFSDRANNNASVGGVIQAPSLG